MPFRRRAALRTMVLITAASPLASAGLRDATSPHRTRAQAPTPPTVDVRLLTPVSSRVTKVGTPVEALVVGSVSGDAVTALPVGSILHGRVSRVRKVGLGLLHETARIAFEFDGLQAQAGKTVPIRTRLVEVDNARERVDSKGTVRGARATASLSHRMAYRAANLALHHPVVCIPLFITQASLVHFPDPEINFPAGTDMTVEVPDATLAMTIPEPPVDGATERILDAIPYWSYSIRQNAPMDIVNLLFVGSRESLERAFTAAQWSPSQRLSRANGYHMIRAVLENNAVPEAPMRTLLLDGAAPDMSWQRTLNTFTKRHHIRVWSRAEDSQGEAVWAAAATHDIAVKLSLRYGFTHDINNNVDVEREKIVNDLRLTGCVDSVARVSRDADLRSAVGEARGELETDGRIAVIKLNECASPHTIEPLTVDPGPRVITRVVRRLTLSARNQYVRNNLPWRMCDLGRMGVGYLRNRYRDYRWRQRTVLAHKGSTTDAN